MAEKREGKKAVKTIETKQEDKVDFQEWLRKIYDVNLITEVELQQMYDAVKYQGFDRNVVLKDLYGKIIDIKLMSEIILVCALRGPQAASMVKLSNGLSLKQMGIPGSGGKGSNMLTCSKISAATADLAAFYMKKLNVPKRILIECPGWLQFPAAASIRMPDNYKIMQKEFATRFSPLIGGIFNEQIYINQQNNSYLNDNLNLFGA
jgi:hypothetical protein